MVLLGRYIILILNSNTFLYKKSFFLSKIAFLIPNSEMCHESFEQERDLRLVFVLIYVTNPLKISK